MINVRQIFLLAVVMLVMIDPADALPRFSSRTGWKCQSCHINPSGGGMRRATGVKYGRQELPVPTWADEVPLDNFSTQLNDVISFGTDVRTLFFYQQDETDDQNAFFQMQGDIYLDLRLTKKVNVYFDKGLYSGFEVYGQVNVLPSNGFFKAGKFVPNYGIKLDEHRAYTREYSGLSPETGAPFFTGAEVAIQPGAFAVTGGIFNSADGRGAATDTRKAFLGRAEGIVEVSDGMHAGLGANILYKDVQGGKNLYWGGFGSFSVGNLTFLGEVDLLTTDVASARMDALVAYGEASYVIVQGLDLRFMYDFYDPDLDLKSGTNSRYSFGFEFFPFSGLELRPLYRINMEKPTNAKNDEFHFVLHFYM